MLNTLIIRFLANTIALYVASVVFVPVRTTDLEALLLSGLVLTFINMLIRPMVIFFTLPINLLTLGLFTLVVNTVMIFLTAYLVPGLIIPSTLLAFLTALIVSVLNLLFQPSRRKRW